MGREKHQYRLAASCVGGDDFLEECINNPWVYVLTMKKIFQKLPAFLKQAEVKTYKIMTGRNRQKNNISSL